VTPDLSAAAIIGHFIAVGGGQFLRRDVEHHARHRIVLAPRYQDGVIGLAPLGQHVGIGDLHHLLSPAGQRIGAAFRPPPELGQLHASLLKRAVGKKQLILHFSPSPGQARPWRPILPWRI
jgi:hypothetical protein